jgi:hypothetical protein
MGMGSSSKLKTKWLLGWMGRISLMHQLPILLLSPDISLVEVHRQLSRKEMAKFS